MAELIVVLSFVLVMVLLIGSFVVLLPVTRRLGTYLERLIEEKRNGEEAGARIEQMQSELLELQHEVQTLAERQSFTDSLLADRKEVPQLAEK